MKFNYLNKSVIPGPVGVVLRRTIGVNLGIFTALCGSVPTDATPLGLGFLADTRFYTNAVPLGLKRVLGYTRFVDRTQCGSKPRLPSLGLRLPFFLN